MFIFLVSKQFLDYLRFNNSLKNILVANVKITRQGAAGQGTQPCWERHTVAPATAGPEDRLSFMLVVTCLNETRVLI